MGKQYFIPAETDGNEAAYQVYDIEEQEDGTLRVTLPGGDVVALSAYAPEPGQVNMVFVEGHQAEAFDVRVRELESSSFEVEIDSQRHSVEVYNERQKRMLVAGAGKRAAGGPELVSPMAGKVVVITASEEQEVAEGECVLIVEAMKMENDIKAHVTGKIARICVEPGQAVEPGDVLALIDY